MTQFWIPGEARYGTRWFNLVLIIGSSLGGCESPEQASPRPLVARTAQPLEEGAIADDLRRLQTVASANWADYLASLPEVRRLEEEAAADDAGAPGGRLYVQFSRRGIVKSLWSYRLRIPVEPSSVDESPQNRASRFLEDHQALFGIASAGTTVIVDQVRSTSTTSPTRVRYRQEQRGLPVFGAGLDVHVTSDGEIAWLSGHLLPDTAVPSSSIPTVSAQEAARVVAGGATTAVLGWYDGELHREEFPGAVRLVWRVFSTLGPGGEAGYGMVDALTAAVLAWDSASDYSEHRETFYGGGGMPLPGTLQFDDICHLSGEAQCPAGWCPAGYCMTPFAWLGASFALWQNTSTVYNYYLFRHGRDSWDNNLCGSPGHPCTNPEFHPMRASSDRGICGMWHNWDYPNPAQVEAGASASLDVVAHEFTHGVTHAEEVFGDTLPAGSLGESFGDVFGQFAEHYRDGFTDWLIDFCGSASHNLASPPSVVDLCDGFGRLLPNPDHYALYRPECGVVHWNSTISSKAAWLMGREASAGSATHYGLQVTGVGEVAAGSVWYRALTQYLALATTYTEFRNALYQACVVLLSGTDEVNCQLALDAIGLWSADSDSTIGWQIIDPVSLSYFAVGGQNRRWIFYRDWTTNMVNYRYRTCTIYGACSWSTPTSLDPGASGPSSTVFGGYLWICFQSTSGGGAVWCDRINSTGSRLTGPDPSGAYTSSAPALAKYGSYLYLAYRRSSDDALVWRRYGTSWGPENLVGSVSAYGPALASSSEDPYPLGSYFWIVYRRTSDGRMVYRLFDSGTATWGAERAVGQDDDTVYSYRPSARMFRGRLHVAGEAWGSVPRYASCAMPCGASAAWSRYVLLDGADSWATGALNLDAAGAWDGRLYLWMPRESLYWRWKRSE